jgi:hypothetical protein
MLKNNKKAIVLGMPHEGEDIHKVSIVEDLVMVYNSLAVK